MLEIVLRRNRRVVGMRMVETDHIQAFFARVLLATHQLFGPNQKAVTLGFFFTRVRNRIHLKNLFPSVFESSEHQAAAFVWIVAFAMGAHSGPLLIVDDDHFAEPVATAPGSDTARACSISATMSFTFSIPTDTRIRPSLIPNSRRRAGERSRCEAVAGCSTLVKTSPRLVDRIQSFSAS